MSAPLAAPADRRLALLVITLLTINAVIWFAVFLVTARAERRPVAPPPAPQACAADQSTLRAFVGVSHADPT